MGRQYRGREEGQSGPDSVTGKVEETGPKSNSTPTTNTSSWQLRRLDRWRCVPKSSLCCEAQKQQPPHQSATTTPRSCGNFHFSTDFTIRISPLIHHIIHVSYDN
jgi:hypothetical protein